MAKHTPASGPGTIEELARWVLAPRADEIPQAAVKQAKLLLLDAIGCGYAALDEEFRVRGAGHARRPGRRAPLQRDRRRAQDQRPQCGPGQWRAHPHSRSQRLCEQPQGRDRRPPERQHPGGAGSRRDVRIARERADRRHRARLRDLRTRPGSDGPRFRAGTASPYRAWWRRPWPGASWGSMRNA